MPKILFRSIVIAFACALLFGCAGKREYVPTKQAMHTGERDARIFTNVPQAALNHHNLAMSCFKRGDLECAARHWREAEKSASRNQEFQYETNYNLGVTFQRMNKHILAEKHFRKAIALIPDDAKARAALGQSFVAMNRFNEAQSAFQDALKYDPNISAAYLGMADMYVRHEKFLEAVVAFRAAVAGNPDYGDVRGALRQSYTALGNREIFRDNLDWAQELFALAQTIDGEDTQAMMGLGHVMLKRGYPGRAKPFYDGALENNPEYKPTAHELMGKQAANEDLVAAVRAQSLADFYLERGDYQHAVEQIELTLSLDPYNADSWTRLGEVYMDQLNNPEKTADCLHALWAMNIHNDRIESMALKMGRRSPNIPEASAPEVVFALAGFDMSSGDSELKGNANSFEAGSPVFRQIRVKGMIGEHKVEKSLTGPDGKIVRSENYEIESVVDEISLTSVDSLLEKGGYQQTWIVDGQPIDKLNFDIH